MTKREREIVRNAIGELMREDGDFNGAVGALCGLVGYRYPASELPSASAMPFGELALRKSQEFAVRFPPARAGERKRKGD